MAPPSLTSAGVQRFQCIGSACEHTCCSGWNVIVDRAHYEALQSRMSSSRAEREEFKGSLLRKKEPNVWAMMQLRPSGDCSFLAPDRLCSLQKRYGEELLPNTCAQYPRLLGQVGERREMWGSLSCPEMVRQCLLTDDGMALVEIAEEPFSRPIERRKLSHPEQPYRRYLDEIRQAALEILSLRQYPIAVRFFFLAYLGKRTESFFHREAQSVDERLLASELVRLRSPAVLQSWHQAFQQLQVPVRRAANVVTGILHARLDRHLAPLIAQVLGSFVSEGSVSEDGKGTFTAKPEPLWEGYRRRRQIWEELCPERIDLYFENHAKNYWMREWYVTSPNLLVHLQNYLCQAAVARFLLFGHPDLLTAARLPDREVQRQALDRTAVEVVTLVARAIEHNSGFIAQVQAAFAQGGMQDFAHTTILLAA